MLYTTYMEEQNITHGRSSNRTYLVEPSRQILPKSPIPAWVPAVSVATIMLIFLAASFYIRHRKVVKKREILMDYFYIILQYGGLRRKRMVTALCNTNAISLRQLGRSFMLSFDSNENSCPFFLEDTAFTKAHTTPIPQNKNTPKSKNRLRVPFKRVMSQIDDNGLGNPVHDMLMKFKSKKKGANASNNRSSLAPPRGISLSSIHEDDQSYSRRSEYEASPRFRQRRNAYDMDGSENQIASLTQLLGESDEQSLSDVVLEHYIARKGSSRKRMSYPCNSRDSEDDEYQILTQNSQNLRVFQFGNNSAISFRQQSSHGRPGSKREPLILVHAASNDISSSQESDDIENSCSNNVVLLRKVSRDQSGQDYFYVGESPAPSFKRNKRASVSTVSYVQPGNMNDYYQHCLQSSTHSINTKVEDDEFDLDDERHLNRLGGGFSWKKCPSTKDSPQHAAGPSRSKRSRLSLGEIGVSNFNRRIEESLGSMHEQDSEGSCSRLSKEVSDERTKPRGAWKRLKNVFAGIRWSQSSGTRSKQIKSSTSEDRSRPRNKRSNNNNNNTRKWNRFFKTLTGFRSFPEEQKHSIISEGPKASKSLPLGLDKHSITIEDLELHLSMSRDAHGQKMKKRNSKNSFSKADIPDGRSPRVFPKTRSFPDNILFFQGDTKTSPCLYHLQSDPGGAPTLQKGIGRKNKRRFNTCDDYLQAHSNVEFLHSPSNSAYFSFLPDSNNRSNRHRSGSTSPRTSSPVGKKRDRRYRSLSPLPEKNSSSPRKGKNVRWYSHSARNSLSDRGYLMSPSPQPNGSIFAFPCENPPKGKSLSDMELRDRRASGSFKGLSAVSLNNVQQNNQSCHADAPANPFIEDFVTIDMELCGTQDVKFENKADSTMNPCIVETRENCNSAQDCKESKTKNSEHPYTDVQTNPERKYSLQINDNTNSSMDSIYFDAFSIPGSPLTHMKQHAASETNSTTHSTDIALSSSPSPEKSLSLLSVSSTFGIDVTTHTACDTTTPTTALIPPVSSCRTNAIPNDQTYAPPPMYSIMHQPVCNNSDYTQQNSTTATTLSPSCFVDIPPDPMHVATDSNSAEQSCVTTESPNENSDDDGDNCDETKCLLEPETLPSSCVGGRRLEHQDSTASEDSCLVHLSRLPRFGRRASGISGPHVPS